MDWLNHKARRQTVKLDFEHQIGEVQSRFAITYDPATEKAEAEQLLQRYAPPRLTEEGSHANTAPGAE